MKKARKKKVRDEKGLGREKEGVRIKEEKKGRVGERQEGGGLDKRAHYLGLILS